MMTDFTKLFSHDQILVGIKPNSKKQIIGMLAEKASPLCQIPSNRITDIVLEREKLGSTGAGHGIAIPHGRIEGLDRMYGFCAVLAEPVDYDAVDNMPVDILIMLLAPERAGAEHLRVLAKVSRMLRNQGTCERLRGCTDTDAIYAILCEDKLTSAA